MVTNKVHSVLFFSIFLIALVSSASYPAPFDSGNTATVVGANSVPSGTIAAATVTSSLPSPSISTPIVKVDNIDIAKKICEVSLGCYERSGCYPFGFIMNRTYCGNYFKEINGRLKYEGSELQSQKGENAVCQYDFECKSNFCLNQQCVNGIQALIGKVLERLASIENGNAEDVQQKIVQVNNLSQERTNISNEKVGFWARLFRR